MFALHLVTPLFWTPNYPSSQYSSAIVANNTNRLDSMDLTTIYEKIQRRYGAAAKSEDREYGRKVATAFGYTAEELTKIPEDANLGLSCGNPLALANLSEVS